MKILAFAVLLAGCSAAVSGAGDTAQDEQKKLDGVWVVQSVLRDPREKNPDQGKGIRCVVSGTKVVAKLPGNDDPAGTLIIKIDPTVRPKAMDMRPQSEKDTILAIYELNGDTLSVCWGPLAKERPTEFASKPGSGHSLVVLKREKR
jgi:uncharacterized protein (TIGR03067 family)